MYNDDRVFDLLGEPAIEKTKPGPRSSDAEGKRSQRGSGEYGCECGRNPQDRHAKAGASGAAGPLRKISNASSLGLRSASDRPRLAVCTASKTPRPRGAAPPPAARPRGRWCPTARGSTSRGSAASASSGDSRRTVDKRQKCVSQPGHQAAEEAIPRRARGTDELHVPRDGPGEDEPHVHGRVDLAGDAPGELEGGKTGAGREAGYTAQRDGARRMGLGSGRARE